MAWPEKTALVLFAFEAIFLAFLGLTNSHAGSVGWFAAIPSLWPIPFFTITPIWAVLRIVDFMTAGPARRHGALIVRPRL